MYVNKSSFNLSKGLILSSLVTLFSLRKECYSNLDIFNVMCNQSKTKRKMF